MGSLSTFDKVMGLNGQKGGRKTRSNSRSIKERK